MNKILKKEDMTDDTQPEKFDLRSLDVAAERQDKLRQTFPEVFTEAGKIDFDRLKSMLGELVDSGKERYGMNWPGKAECFRTIQAPSRATLRPKRDESVSFDDTENIIIEGDNLEVLKLLQKGYLGKVKMIYIDPPYNTGNDFIYPDNYAESLETYLSYTKQVDETGKKFSSNPDTDGRFHSKWLNMMYPRLFLARNLLNDEGLIFVSIDDHEAHALRLIMNEIFGEENFVAQFIWNTEGHTDNQFEVKITHEYVVVYARDVEKAGVGHVVDPNTREESNLWKGFAENSVTKNGPANPPSRVLLPAGFPCAVDELELEASTVEGKFYDEVRRVGYITREMTDRFSCVYPLRLQAMKVRNGELTAPCEVFAGWANLNKLKAFIQNGCKPIDDNGDPFKFYLSDRGVIYYRKERKKARNIVSVLRNMGTTEKMRAELESVGINFQYPKPKELLRYLVRIGSENGGIVLDFFAGSGTTAQAVYEQCQEDAEKRNFILVQLPETTEQEDFPTIAEITRRRVQKVMEKTGGQIRLIGGEVDAGFRYYKLDESNFRPWDGTQPEAPDGLFNQLELHVDHVLPERSQADILTELLLKSGFPLSTKVEAIQLAGKHVFSVEDGAMLVCLDDNLTPDVIKAIADKKPSRVICLDAGFMGNDQLKTNAVQTMKARGVLSFRTV